MIGVIKHKRGIEMNTIISGMDIGFGQVKACLKKEAGQIQTVCFARIFAEAKKSDWELMTKQLRFSKRKDNPSVI